MASRLVYRAHDPLTGSISEVHRNDDTKELWTYHDVTKAAANKIMDTNHELSTMTPPKTVGGGRYAGSVPFHTYYQWRRAYRDTGACRHMEWPRFLALKLNDYNNKRLRIWGGKL